MLRNRPLSAFVYGMLLAPMTLPCTGPLIISAFVLGVGDTRSLIEGLFYFLAFGLGFGWPLVLLPLLAAPMQRQFTRWFSTHYKLIGRVAGLLLVGIGMLGIYTDFLS